MLRDLHERTKDLSGRFVPSPDRPDPFRAWEGTESIPLPLLDDPSLPCKYLFQPLPDPSPFTLESISKFLELSAGITGIYGDVYRTVRANPSAGNLHPEETYLLLSDGSLHHYNVKDHALSLRGRLRSLESLLPDGGFFVITTAIYWRTLWKYGVRGFRYALLDIGHLYGSFKAAGHLMGWRVMPLWNASPYTLERILGFDKVRFPNGEGEYPQLVMAVVPPLSTYPSILPVDLSEGAEFYGEPNRLSPDAVVFEDVLALERETRKGYVEEMETLRSPAVPHIDRFKGMFPEGCDAVEVIRRRRSPFIYRDDNFVSRDVLESMVEVAHALREEGVTFKVFAQRVLDTKDGAYDPYLNPLKLGRIRDFLVKLTCNQKHCGDANLNFVIVSNLDLAYEVPKLYRTIHYRAGSLGQLFYLLAEVFSLNGNAIGCFNDDLLAVYGITDLSYIHHVSAGIGNTPESWKSKPFRYARKRRNHA